MQHKLRSWKSLIGLAITWIIVTMIFAFWKESLVPGWQSLDFASRENIETIARQTAIVGFGAIGMTFIIVGGMIDLSAGSVVAFVTVVIAWLLDRFGGSILVASLAAVVGIAAGALCGAFNGQMITRLRLSPFIATLGSLLIVRGAATGIAHEQKIDAPITWLASILAKLGPGQSWMILPWGVWMVVVCAFGASFLLERTVFGRNVTAVGANETAARLAGISPDRVRRAVFMLAGAFIGMGGLLQFSRLTVGDPTVAEGLELDIIAATVIGGASLNGGRGTIAGSLLGAVIISTIRSGCTQVGLPNWVQRIVTGGIIVAALALDRIREASSETA